MNTWQKLTPERIQAWLKPRPADCHKGDFGSVAVLGGAPGMAGGALLGARGALGLGAGRVYAGLLDSRIGLDPQAPEIMVCSPEHALAIQPPGCLVVGPGLGVDAAAHGWLAEALSRDLPLLLDADALNLLALDTHLADHLRRRAAPALITPHPGEAGRLLGWDTAAIQADRPAAAQALLDKFRCGVVLKGAGSLVCSPAGGRWRNPTGNPGMAAPGMGDVLAGMIGALVAQGLDVEQAAVTGVWLHGAAADTLVGDGLGPVGLAAGELPAAARRALNQLLAS
jgi:hydroxyethylthiazole kinase-like uncharacterized protein yjeF